MPCNIFWITVCVCLCVCVDLRCSDQTGPYDGESVGEGLSDPSHEQWLWPDAGQRTPAADHTPVRLRPDEGWVCVRVWLGVSFFCMAFLNDTVRQNTGPKITLSIFVCGFVCVFSSSCSYSSVRGVLYSNQQCDSVVETAASLHHCCGRLHFRTGWWEWRPVQSECHIQDTQWTLLCYCILKIIYALLISFLMFEKHEKSLMLTKTAFI